MSRLVTQAHQLLRATLRPGDAAIDATAGNGRDTLALANAVGPTGRVYAFDVQHQAIQATARLLAQHGVGHVELLQRSHDEIDRCIPPCWRAKVGGAAFNLGYMPHGDQQLTTTPLVTCAAVRQALGMLRAEGVVTVVAYTGHPGGLQEAAAVYRLLSGLRPDHYTRLDDPAAPVASPAPRLMAVRRRV